MRRDKNDVEWQMVKRRVSKRDHHCCRLMVVCSAKDACTLNRLAPSTLLNKLDHAHIFPVSRFPHIMYCDDNIYLLNRYSHHMIDDYCNPITGARQTTEEHEAWWIKIAGEENYMRVKALAYPESTNCTEENNMSDEKETVVLNEKEVSVEELNKVKQDPSKRVIEESPDKFRTLNRMYD